ncbi:MAG: IS1595 family transposase [Rhodospirillales bacterium]
MSKLSNAIFHNPEKARIWLERQLWPEGPVCPHCGSVDQATLLKGETTRPGLYQCNACREPFTVTVGTLYERSHIPLNKWLMATHLLMASKKGLSTRQVARMLDLPVKTAWFMMHRVRESMRKGGLAPMGGNYNSVEVDETFIGHDSDNPPKGRLVRGGNKMKVLALVDRTTGEARSMVVDNLKAQTLVPIVRENVAKDTAVMTDGATYYNSLRKHFLAHETVDHMVNEYVRGDVHTNTVEGYFSVFKRGMKGTYQHCAKKHLHRYLAEFDFRYTNRIAKGVDDSQRTAKAIKGIVGKRLTYRRTNQPEAI